MDFNFNAPQLTPFTRLAKIKLAISIAFDLLRLIFSTTLVIGFAVFLYLAYQTFMADYNPVLTHQTTHIKGK